jgi:hypothetical protein
MPNKWFSAEQIRGVDIDQNHGVDIIRVNDIMFDKANNRYRRVPHRCAEGPELMLHSFDEAL